jgi:hypothetical protein
MRFAAALLRRVLGSGLETGTGITRNDSHCQSSQNER